jgi:hypothetical protein
LDVLSVTSQKVAAELFVSKPKADARARNRAGIGQGSDTIAHIAPTF